MKILRFVLKTVILPFFLLAILLAIIGEFLRETIAVVREWYE